MNEEFKNRKYDLIISIDPLLSERDKHVYDRIFKTQLNNNGKIYTVTESLHEAFKNFNDYHINRIGGSLAKQLFQSKEKTLSDDEINDIMLRVTKSIEQKGWQVR